MPYYTTTFLYCFHKICCYIVHCVYIGLCPIIVPPFLYYSPNIHCCIVYSVYTLDYALLHCNRFYTAATTNFASLQTFVCINCMYTLFYALLHCPLYVYIGLCLITLLHFYTAATTHIVHCVYIGFCLITLPPFYTAATTYIFALYTVCIHWIMPYYMTTYFVLLPQHTLLHCTLCVYIEFCLITLPPFYTAATTYIFALYTVCIHWI